MRMFATSEKATSSCDRWSIAARPRMNPVPVSGSAGSSVGMQDHDFAHMAVEAGGTLEETSVPPKLTKETIEGPATLPCGYFKWRIAWKLDKPTPKGGLVVQKVDAKFSAVDAKGGPYTLPVEKYDPNWYPFWEAWEVPKGQTSTPFCVDRFESAGQIVGTKGSQVITGTAEFYEGAKLDGTTFTVLNKPPAGLLPMTKTDPKLKGGTGPIEHSLAVTWDCAAKGKSKTGVTGIAIK